MGGGPSEVQYLVLPDRLNPFLLARVRWPDIAQAISPGRPGWRDDPGLFDLPYDRASVPVTAAEAEAIATSWGAPFEAMQPGEARPLARRTPSGFSELPLAEQPIWPLEQAPPGPGLRPTPYRVRRSRAETGGRRLLRRLARRATPAPADGERSPRQGDGRLRVPAEDLPGSRHSV